MTDLTAEFLRQILAYAPATGLFTRIQRPRPGAKVGDLAGTLDTKRGYIRIGIRGSIHRARRLAWLHVYGMWPAGEIDHVNGVKHDNRIQNLRIASRTANQQNIVSANRNSSSGMRGVYPHGARWRARIYAGGRSISLGLFDTAEAASAAYKRAKAELHPGAAHV